MSRDVHQDSLALLGHRHPRYKALALSVGACLAVRRPPGDALGLVEQLVVDSQRATAEGGRDPNEHFGACRDAANLRVLARDTAGGEPPSASGLNATRASHQSLRKLVWKFVSRAHVHRSGHVGELDPGPDMPLAVGSRGV